MSFKGKLSACLLGLAIGVGFGTFATSAAEKLVISSWAPPTHGINAKLWPRFIEMIEKATDGRVTAEIKYKLASPPAQFDLIQDGAADFGWIVNRLMRTSANLALVAYRRVENCEKGLARLAVAPAGFPRRVVPDVLALDRVVIFLGIVGGVVTGVAQVRWEHA